MEGRTLLGPPCQREERLGEGWLARGVRKQCSSPDATPQPETGARVISGKPEVARGSHFKRSNSLADQGRWTGRGPGGGGGGEPDSSDGTNIPLAKPSSAPRSRDRAQAERCNTQRQFDFLSGAGQKARGAEKKGPCSSAGSALATAARPAARPRPWLSRCVGPTAAQASGNWAANQKRHPLSYAGLCSPHPFFPLPSRIWLPTGPAPS